jgi:hypothetical protein
MLVGVRPNNKHILLALEKVEPNPQIVTNLVPICHSKFWTSYHLAPPPLKYATLNMNVLAITHSFALFLAFLRYRYFREYVINTVHKDWSESAILNGFCRAVQYNVRKLNSVHIAVLIRYPVPA